MKLFLDTADIKEIKRAKSWGVLSGITTNPSIISRQKRDFCSLATEICETVYPMPVSLEVVDREGEAMADQARKLSEISRNVVVKLPANPAGMEALTLLRGESVKTNLTLVFSPTQALLASMAGADYVSPFIGRLEDRGYDGLGMVRELMDALLRHDSKTEVIAASIRDPHQIVEIAKAGVHIATVPFVILEKMLLNTMTDMDLEKFLKDWEEVPGREYMFREEIRRASGA
ncbi:MAG: transaldolase family protein [Thermodesulfobacteriota bacterium]